MKAVREPFPNYSRFNYVHNESNGYPADIDMDDIDDSAVLELRSEHHNLFGEVPAGGYESPDDLVEFEGLFHVSARDRAR